MSIYQWSFFHFTLNQDSNVPRDIIDTGNYLFLRTDCRLYIVGRNFELIQVIDFYKNAKFIITPVGFAMIANKNLKWYSTNGFLMGEIMTKHPIRATYLAEDELKIETRQHQASINLN